VHFVGEISMDGSGFGVGPKIDALHVLAKLREVYASRGTAARASTVTHTSTSGSDASDASRGSVPAGGSR
jgi:hypothetical protein